MGRKAGIIATIGQVIPPLMGRCMDALTLWSVSERQPTLVVFRMRSEIDDLMNSATHETTHLTFMNIITMRKNNTYIRDDVERCVDMLIACFD